jgi:hypothetical protein
MLQCAWLQQGSVSFYSAKLLVGAMCVMFAN